MRKQAQAELSWALVDYQARGIEPPRRIIELPEMCEGDLMTAEEIEQYIYDAVSTLKILQDKGSDRFAEIQAAFFADLEFLLGIGRINEDEYNELINQDVYHF